MAEHAVTDTETLEMPTETTERLAEHAIDDLADIDDGSGESDIAVADPKSVVRLALLIGLVVVVGLAGLVAWLGFQQYKSNQALRQQNLFIQVARQGALNLTTVDWQHADNDVSRILDSATGTFLEDFSQRSKPFVEVVKKAQSKSVGTITETGLESESADEAQVLVALSVTTSSQGAAEQEPRHWRMRISVRRDGSNAKVSNVAFVP